MALCWIHEGRHYNRLDPVVPISVDALKDFKTRFWDFYGDLLKYKQNPSPETTAKDVFLTIVQTAKKLEVNAFEYIRDRVSKKFSMPALSDLIIEKAKLQPG